MHIKSETKLYAFYVQFPLLKSPSSQGSDNIWLFMLLNKKEKQANMEFHLNCVFKEGL